jgi:hypothetical protein
MGDTDRDFAGAGAALAFCREGNLIDAAAEIRGLLGL